MPSARVTVSTPIERTGRARLLEGMFDIPPAETQKQEWDAHLPIEEKPWHIGLIVGPSGSGKSTVTKTLFGQQLSASTFTTHNWPSRESILEVFPQDMETKDIVALLSSVGFSSPPAWLRPFHVLSTGEQFRVTLARLLASAPDIAVMDEYTSVVDRTVAKIGSAALAKTVRNLNKKFIAVTCHEDVEDWLQPDWTYRPATNTFAWRLLRQRPAINIDITRTATETWRLFRHHHYLDKSISPYAQCFLALWDGRPVAFSAWGTMLTKGGGKREHRTVTLPDYQGIGIGFALSTFVASLYTALGQRATSTTTHPAFIAARCRSPLWKMTRRPALHIKDSPGRLANVLKHAQHRMTAGFAYIGPPADIITAHRLLPAKL